MNGLCPEVIFTPWAGGPEYDYDFVNGKKRRRICTTRWRAMLVLVKKNGNCAGCESKLVTCEYRTIFSDYTECRTRGVPGSIMSIGSTYDSGNFSIPFDCKTGTLDIQDDSVIGKN